MRSGLYNYTNAPELAATVDRDPTKVWNTEELLAIAFARPPNFPPGTAYEYNNTNYTLLGLIAEKVDGKPMARAMQDRLFGPLGMHDTLLPPRTSNTIPDPYSHGYLYGSSLFVLTDTPYPPDIQAAARARSEYNNTNYTLLGLIAEKVDGKPMARAMQDRLFGPLGMHDTLLPPRTSNTIPDPYSHGYLYGSSLFVLTDTPYPPDIQAAARA